MRTQEGRGLGITGTSLFFLLGNPMRHSSFLALLLLLAPACDGKKEPGPPTPAKPAASTVKAPQPVGATPETKPKDKPKRPKRKTKAQIEKERKTFQAELDALDRQREGVEKLATSTPGNRAHQERIAGSFIQRARLTGSYEDYAKAEAAVAKAHELSPASETFLLRAKLHYTLHRLPEAQADFAKAKEKALPTPDAKASILAFQGNFALQAGDDSTAAEQFDASLAVKRTMSNLASSAVYHWKTGEFEKAEELFREALAAYHGKPMEPRAWLHLNLGLLDLDRGRYDDALVHYREAESFLTGYWLIEEHIAEILTLQGKIDEARAMYLDIIERTNNPEFMDAMAAITLDAGDEGKSNEWVAKARSRYEEQMEKYPEAAYGHALGHYLEFGDDPAFVLELAQKNYELRPNLDASIMLAQAQLKAGNAKAAEGALEKILKSKFKSAELYVTAAEVQAALGRGKKAESWLERAKAIDPTASLETDDSESSE